MTIANLHKDTCKVYRAISEKDDYGAWVEKFALVHDSIPCRLSQKWLRTVVVGDNNSSTQEYKLFTGLEADILQNDRLVVMRFADKSKYTFKASKPFAYAGIPHKEIALSEISENEVEP